MNKRFYLIIFAFLVVLNSSAFADVTNVTTVMINDTLTSGSINSTLWSSSLVTADANGFNCDQTAIDNRFCALTKINMSFYPNVTYTMTYESYRLTAGRTDANQPTVYTILFANHNDATRTRYQAGNNHYEASAEGGTTTTGTITKITNGAGVVLVNGTTQLSGYDTWCKHTLTYLNANITYNYTCGGSSVVRSAVNGSYTGGSFGFGMSYLDITRFRNFLLINTTASQTIVNISFHNQTPSDITSTTLFTGNVTIQYNITNTTLMNNTFINFSMVSPVRSCLSFLNGSCSLLNNSVQQIYSSSNTTQIFNYSLTENNVYPSIRWLNDSFFGQVHSSSNLTTNNDYYKLAFLNISNQTQFNFFEVMANSTGTTDIHYCNSSYTTGNVQASPFCVEIYNAVLNINHSHGSNSAHALVPFTINNSRVGNVYVTSLSYFVIRGGNTVVYFISNSTGRTNITQVSTNNGGSFTDFSNNRTVDSHIHQFTLTDYVSYLGCRNMSNIYECTGTQTDNLDLTAFPPIGVQINVPEQATYQQYINISYLIQTHPNTPNINNSAIRIDLLNNDSTFNQTIRFNALNSSYLWNTYDYNLELNKNYYLNITINDTRNNRTSTISEPFNFSTNGYINVTAKTIGGATITTFSVNVTNATAGINANYSTTNGVILADIVKGYTYNVFIDATGYAYDSTNKTTPATYNNHTFNLYTTNSFNIRFYDEVTKALLSTYNISLEIISDVFANNYTTSNGTLYLDLLSPSTYTFRYKSLPTYPERTYIVDLANRQTINLSLYLVNTTTTITLNVKDQNDNILENAYIKVLRYDIVTNSYTVREIVKTNVEGNAYFSAILNTEFYKFIVEYPLGEEVLVTSPDYIRSTGLTLRVNLESNPLSDYYASINTYSILTFNDVTNNFNFYYNDASNTANQGCLYVYRTINFVNTLINSSCVSSSSGTILLGVTNTSGYTYTAQGTVFIGETEYLLKTLSKTFSTVQNGNNKNNFFFLTLLLTAILGLLFVWNITIALIVTPIPIFLMSLTDMIPVSRSVGITLMLISLTLAFVISKKA